MAWEFNKDMIMEDVQFIYDYLSKLDTKHPEVFEEETDLMVKMYRRLKDIEERVKGA